MSRDRDRRHVRGFSLIEVLIALFILAIVLLGVAPLFLQGTKSNAAAFDYTTAAALVREKLEELKQTPKNAAALSVAAGHSENILNTTYKGPGQVGFLRSWACVNYNLTGAGVPDYSNPITVPATPYAVKEITVIVVPTNSVVDANGNSVPGKTSSLPGFRRSSARLLWNNPDPSQGDTN
jgi:prepilin-type N-terminal cleavage/methylation domain-containing protein